jgi:hypothetical protein
MFRKMGLDLSDFIIKVQFFVDQKRFPEPFGLSAEKKIEKKTFPKKWLDSGGFTQ